MGPQLRVWYTFSVSVPLILHTLMKITFVMPSAQSYSGGIRVIMAYATKLRERGHDVRLVCRKRRKPNLRKRLRLMMDGRSPKVSANAAFSPNGFDVHEVDLGVPITDEHVPDGDVVIATWWETAKWVADLSPEKGAKAYFMQDYGSESQPMDLLVDTWRLPLHMITISPWLKRVVLEHVDVPVDVVENSVDFDVFYSGPRTKPEAPTVGFVYSASPEKGIDICIKAVERARRKVPDLRVIAFGSNLHPDRVPLPDYVDFRLRVPDPELHNVYAECTAWLFGSRREGYGLPILEALACRTPVIATPGGVAGDYMQPEFGVLVDHEDIAGMSDAIIRFARMSPEEWKTMSDAGYEHVRGYTWDDAAGLFESSLKRCLASSDPARVDVAAVPEKDCAF